MFTISLDQRWNQKQKTNKSSVRKQKILVARYGGWPPINSQHQIVVEIFYFVVLHMRQGGWECFRLSNE